MSEVVQSHDGPLEYLIVDDDRLFAGRLTGAIESRGLGPALQAHSIDEALTAMRTRQVRRMILDLRIHDRSGMELMQFVAANAPQIQVLILTGYGSIATATTAIKLGALNFLTKPVSVDRILQGFEELPQNGRIEQVPSLSQVEWEHINRVMDDHGGNVSHAAKALGMHRRSLQRKLQKSPGRLR